MKRKYEFKRAELVSTVEELVGQVDEAISTLYAIQNELEALENQLTTLTVNDEDSVDEAQETYSYPRSNFERKSVGW